MSTWDRIGDTVRKDGLDIFQIGVVTVEKAERVDELLALATAVAQQNPNPNPAEPLSDAALERLEEQVALSKVQSPTRYREEERAGVQLLAAFPALVSRLRLAEAARDEWKLLLTGVAGACEMLRFAVKNRDTQAANAAMLIVANAGKLLDQEQDAARASEEDTRGS